MLALAGPVVMAEVGWMSMGLVDTLMVGRLGPEAIGAVGIGSAVLLVIGVIGIGILLSLDTLVSQAFGAGRLDECHAWLRDGVYLSVALTIPLTGVAWIVLQSLDDWGFGAGVLEPTRSYLAIVTGSLLPLMLYAAFRRYLQAMGVATPVMFALVSANLVNVVVNWTLIFGHWGFPALGVDGAGWATSISRVYMALTLLVAIVVQERRLGAGLGRVSLAVHPARLLALARLGLPAALQITLEVGVFAAGTALAGRLAATSLAAHQIALNIASLTFMVPLGVSAAAAVRVGQAVGRRDPIGVRHAGWTALAIGVGFMACSAAIFLAVPRLLIGLFSRDVAVIEIGAALLLVAAVFQLFDGLQGVATGVLRGLGDTRTPMLWNLAGHWAIGLPLAYWLAFVRDWGVIGIWWGLSTGLIVIGLVLLRAWQARSRALDDLPLAAGSIPPVGVALSRSVPDA